MSDIVEQYNSARLTPAPAQMLKDAIDEITRLRAENEKFFKQAEMNARLLTENASLRAENETLRRDVKTAVMGDSAELQDVKRENEKLRSAFRVNMLRAFPQMSHDEIDAEIEAAIRGSGDE